jgi:hypothetical protein
MPSSKAARIETSRKERNGFTLPHVINKIRQAMHNARMSKVIDKILQTYYNFSMIPAS